MADDVTKLHMFKSAWFIQYVASNWLIFAGFCMVVVLVGVTPTSLHVIPTEGVLASPTSPHQPLSVLILALFLAYYA